MGIIGSIFCFIVWYAVVIPFLFSHSPTLGLAVLVLSLAATIVWMVSLLIDNNKTNNTATTQDASQQIEQERLELERERLDLERQRAQLPVPSGQAMAMAAPTSFATSTPIADNPPPPPVAGGVGIDGSNTPSNPTGDLAAFKRKANAMRKSGIIRARDEMGAQKVTCANGHHYLLVNFITPNGDFGCPSCGTSLGSYDDPDARRFFMCMADVSGVSLDADVPDGAPHASDYDYHWFADSSSTCPLCTWAKAHGFTVEDYPLDENDWNREKLRSMNAAQAQQV